MPSNSTLKTTSLNQALGPVVRIGKKDYLFFSGTSYLGMEADRHYEAVLQDCIRQYGANHGLSRVNNVRLKVFEEFEQFFAKKAKAEAAAVMSSGYLAGIAASQWLFPRADTCWAAPDTHPAILPLGQQVDTQVNFMTWKKKCLEQAEALSSRKILIFGNAVNPLRAEIHEYAWVKELAKKHEVTLLLDESHAFGVLGKTLFGTYADLQHPQLNLVVSGSLGKGLAMPAGIILGKEEVIEGIKSQSIFTGASPGSPANLQAFLETQDIYSAQSRKIRDFSGIFNQETRDLSTVIGSPNFPVFVLKNPSWSKDLEKLGFITSSFSYPTADSPTISRIVLSAFHALGDLVVLNGALHYLSSKP
ncbi:MAG: aminotransferase class I/II-fold pyridoxal phosphate-dependent enzyme [Algoriphagus sp.]